ncbi:hypothetical protein KL86DYS1_31663 [uncultured Dysgonomonas sp.]|uniref:Uncharacterized protein n=1 Tax=uncultured Dysgonomonas sp. TaxID=206096 RepID=A0A212K7E4_9BACT|nr:hypothetical protein KL86DYS1_31663 [uncultured Dysgonomonas sp.]
MQYTNIRLLTLNLKSHAKKEKVSTETNYIFIDCFALNTSKLHYSPR